jgi:hypothetical protein
MLHHGENDGNFEIWDFFAYFAKMRTISIK